MSESNNQKLVRIESKEHYYYDAKSKIIYYIRKNLGKIEKVSSGVIFEDKGSIIRASRIIPIKLKERQDKTKRQKQSLNKLVGDYLENMTDLNSHFHKSKNTPVSLETLESYKTSKSHLMPFFEGYLPSELIPDANVDPHDFKDPWIEFIKYFEAKNPGFNLFNITKHFRALTKYMHDNGIISKRPKVFNPNAQKEKVSRRKKTHRTFDPMHITMMDLVCSEDQRGALWLGYNEAFRQDDCVSLEWSRINLGASPSVIFHGDDNKAKFVGKIPLSDISADWLRQRRKGSTSPFVFPLKSDQNRSMLPQAFQFETVIRESGVNFGSHKTLRHTRLTEDFGNSELDNALVMKVRRVSLAVALESYIHPTDGQLEKFRNTGKAKKGSTW